MRPHARFAALATSVALAATHASLSLGAPAAGAYLADPAQSRLEFVGVQAGAEFKAVFKKFTAAVQFVPENLTTANIDVTIDLSSVDSGDKDRDGTIRGPDIFDIAHNPTAHYVTRGVTKTATGFAAQGSLTLRGVTKDVPIEFQFQPAGAGAKLIGTAKLKRLDFGVGQGDWKSTEWVKDDVKINFSLALTPKP